MRERHHHSLAKLALLIALSAPAAAEESKSAAEIFFEMGVLQQEDEGAAAAPGPHVDHEALDAALAREAVETLLREISYLDGGIGRVSLGGSIFLSALAAQPPLPSQSPAEASDSASDRGGPARPPGAFADRIPGRKPR